MDDEMIQMLGFLAVPLGIAMRWLYLLVNSYGWTIIIFTFVVRLLMMPLTIRQQKSQARMSAYQPMIQEIQKKWQNDKNRQNEEVMKFQEENNVKMTAGCLPMVLNMVVLFSIIVVIQAPLNYILRLDATQIGNGVAIVEYYDHDSTIAQNTYTQESILIGHIIDDPQRFIDGVDVESTTTNEDGSTTTETVHVAMDEAAVEAVLNFNFEFLGMNLSVVPSMSLNIYLILPILSVLTMFASQIIVMKTGGQSQTGGQRTQMLVMTVVMGAFFGWYAFTVPVAFSLYYTASNVVQTLQQIIAKRIYDPEKIKQEVIDEIEERKKAKKAKKKVRVQSASGEIIEQDLSDAELVKLRLARAREEDALKYAEDSKEDEEKLQKAREKDKERYEAKKEPAKLTDAADETEDKTTAEASAETTDTEQSPPAEAAQNKEPEQPKKEYKPGRRKRARQNKESGSSFAEKEMAAEAANEDKEG